MYGLCIRAFSGIGDSLNVGVKIEDIGGTGAYSIYTGTGETYLGGDLTVVGNIKSSYNSSVRISNHRIFFTDEDGNEHELVFKDDICFNS